MVTPQHQRTITPDALDAGAPGVVDVWVSEAEFRVHAALTRLQGAAEFWCGSQAALAVEADYDVRTVRTATRGLEARGLLRVMPPEVSGRPLTYVLSTGSPDGTMFTVRRRSRRTGRDVVRSARPAGLAAAQIATLVESLRHSEGADQGGGSQGRITPDHMPGGAPDSSSPSLSSSSSSIRPPLPPSPAARPIDPPPPDDGALPAGWEDVVAALLVAGYDPEAEDVVRELASAPSPSLWQEAIERSLAWGGESPYYVLAVYRRTVLPRWEREQRAPVSVEDMLADPEASCSEPSIEAAKQEAPPLRVEVHPLRPRTLRQAGLLAGLIVRVWTHRLWGLR